jgi:hypothetical protein
MVRTLCVLLFRITPALAVTVLVGCGSGDDRANVENSLRQFVSTVVPQESGFPLGAGFPRVTENSCKKIPPGVHPAHVPTRFPKGISGWSCSVTLGKTALPVVVEVKDSGGIFSIFPGASPDAPKPRPFTTYEGGP